MSSPLFSVVIPVYNRAQIVSRAIDSVLAQTFTDYEIIIIDDGSKDNLKKVCDDYNCSKIIYIYQENSGSNPARNNGIKNARGYYISFLDSDDSWEKEYLEEVYKKFLSDEEIGIVYVNKIRKYLPGGSTWIKKIDKIEGNIYREVLLQDGLTTSSCLTAKRSLLLSINGWDNNLASCQDDDICIRLAKIAKAGFVDKILCTFYIDEQISRISSSVSKRAENTLLLWKKFSNDIISLCGEKELASKISKVYKMFYSIKNRDGIKQCEAFLIDTLKYSKVKILFFKYKCNTDFHFMNIIKKTVEAFLPIKITKLIKNKV